ncbi:class II fumarate hydratase [Silanimonas sp.]|uniref:class II fumarate hydratase n=1 Tax=Silanimonas sp. TaxID=1929290 RepID=UPI0022CB998C|nr:class II fumarate hydratase [Silanimonas sp.]MCZ8165206.1 class II fumarate hydratase [Silanimonas sp.]
MAGPTRTERDSMGELAVPAEALWGAQTQRAVENFPISGWRMPRGFLRALGLIKAAAAEANAGLGLLDAKRGEAIRDAALKVAAGEFDAEFPVDVFQTGSGTSSNMNANEVIAHVAHSLGGMAVHPNDHVNLGQSSNDVVPTAIQVGAVLAVRERLLPALEHLRHVVQRRAHEHLGTVKTGRTHLMDAMPLTLGQELFAWASQVGHAEERLKDAERRLRALPLGGTAVGTGINAHPRFAERAIAVLAQDTGVPFQAAANPFMGIAAQDGAVELSGQLNGLAVVLMKISNDLRWMNSGPLAGLGEIELPALQPGSSIMPGKVNPVIPEAVAMVAAQVMGMHATISVAAQSGNFQLNVMLPVIAHNLLWAIELSANAARLLADRAIAGFTVREDRLQEALARNPILVTALNPLIGYEKAASIAKKAYASGRPILDVAVEETGLNREVLAKALDPLALTKGGIVEGLAGGG